MRTDTGTLIKALEILVNDIQSEDGVANAAISEAAQRLGELESERDKYKQELMIVLSSVDSIQDINKIKADAVMSYCKNMLDIENAANIKGEQGMRMMASFAAKTSKEYADKIENQLPINLVENANDSTG